MISVSEIFFSAAATAPAAARGKNSEQDDAPDYSPIPHVNSPSNLTTPRVQRCSVVTLHAAICHENTAAIQENLDQGVPIDAQQGGRIVVLDPVHFPVVQTAIGKNCHGNQAGQGFGTVRRVGAHGSGLFFVLMGEPR